MFNNFGKKNKQFLVNVFGFVGFILINKKSDHDSLKSTLTYNLTSNDVSVMEGKELAP